MAAVTDVFNTSTRSDIADPFLVPTSLATSCHTGGATPQASTDGSNQTPVITEIYVAEINVPASIEVTGIAFFNGATAGTDSRHAALLDKDGALVSGTQTGADAFSGTDAYQRVAFTGGAMTINGPAIYFVAQIISGTTDRCNAHTSGDFVSGKITSQTYAAIPATNTLPTTFTTALGPMASLY